MTAASQVDQVTHKYPLSNFPIARKLTDNQVDEINKIALEAIGSNAEISRMAGEFNAKPYDSEFWDHKNYKLWPIFALKAHTQGLLDRFQTATIIFQYAVVSQFIEETQAYETHEENFYTRSFKLSPPSKREVKNRPIWVNLSDSRFKEILTELIQAKIKKNDNTYVAYHFQQPGEIEKVVDYIINSLTTHRSSEQSLFMVDGVNNIGEYSNLLSRFQEGNIPFNGIIKIDNEPKIVVPSFTILQLFFKYLRPNNHIKLDPLIGTATTKDISDLRMKNRRLVSLPFPITSLDRSKFVVADDFLAGFAGFIIHDAVYHSFKISSLLPSENNAILHVLSSVIDPYICDSEIKLAKQLEAFF